MSLLLSLAVLNRLSLSRILSEPRPKHRQINVGEMQQRKCTVPKKMYGTYAGPDNFY
jgi:hypothetical protein